MKASKLRLIHFRSARDLTIDLGPGLNLLVGVNGAGKSTILDSLAIMLSWAAARLRSPNASGRRILDMDIHNKKNSCWLDLTCETSQGNMREVNWRLAQTRKGRNPDGSRHVPVGGMTLFEELREWASNERDRMSQSEGRVNLPLFVYYPVNRSVLDIPLKIKTTHTFDLLEAYDGAFTVGVNFRHFFEWYRNREDLENEGLRESGTLTEDPQLQAVRKAILTFLPDFSEISVKRSPLRMEVTKRGEKYRVDQMSDGEKCLFAMVGDLARRLAIANPDSEDALQGEGIVLIDEIDLHLHPSWQRMVTTKITETFPNCQFIVSTHSPQVFGEVDAQCVRRLSIEPPQDLVATTPDHALGLDSSEILEEQMEAQSRNQGISDQLEAVFRRIDQEDFAAAKTLIEALHDKVKGSIPELVRAESLITMLEPDAGEKQ